MIAYVACCSCGWREEALADRKSAEIAAQFHEETTGKLRPHAHETITLGALCINNSQEANSVATGTILNVIAKNEARNAPGIVEFTDGTKLSTFDDGLIAQALNARGQIAEYDVQFRQGKNGKQYTNLSKLVVRNGSAPLPSPVREPIAPVPPIVPPSNNFGQVAEIESAITRLAGVIQSLTVAVERGAAILRLALPNIASAPVDNGYRESAQSEIAAIPAPDPIAIAQERLGRDIGPDAAAAQFDFLRTKHAKHPKKLAEASMKLLAAHGIEG
jgi:hypothetical protein